MLGGRGAGACVQGCAAGFSQLQFTKAAQAKRFPEKDLRQCFVLFSQNNLVSAQDKIYLIYLSSRAYA